MAGFVDRLRYQDIPAKALEMARTAIMDTLGVSLAGGTEESARAIGRVVLEERARQESTIYGQRFKSSALQAALVNGTAAHAHDFDHSFVRGGQPTAPIIPAIFALGEAQESSGQQILEAYVAGVEVVARLIIAVAGAGAAGWHANNTIGVFGASAGCAKLLGLKEPEIEMALAIAASMGSGLTANFTDSSTDSDGSIVSRSWNFGDGGTSTATNPSRTYAAAGTYTVTLTVTDDDGATNTKTGSVTVTALPL